MKKEMDIRLYKYEIIKGKEETAEEWLNFLNANRKAAICMSTCFSPVKM